MTGSHFGDLRTSDSLSSAVFRWGFVQIHMHTCCDEWNVRKHPAIQVNTVPQGLLGLPGRVLPGPPSH